MTVVPTGSEIATEVVQACLQAFVPNQQERSPQVEVSRIELGRGWVEEWIQAQHEDPEITSIWLYWKKGRLPVAKEWSAAPRPVRVLLRQWDRLCVQQGLLCRGILNIYKHLAM